MRYHVLTLFPDMIRNGLEASIIGRAIENELIDLNLINIRDFSIDKHKQVDDYPYGGGAGMVMTPQPIFDAYEYTKSQCKTTARVIYLTPQGKTFSQEMARELAEQNDIIFLCGHYEGVDERVVEEIVTDEVSIGDYILTGGELAVMVMIDAISRHLKGVLNNEDSTHMESFENGLLEYPQYTRPSNYKGLEVPEVLLSGHHERINSWRREQSLLRTIKKRPDLINNDLLSEKDKRFLQNILHKK